MATFALATECTAMNVILHMAGDTCPTRLARSGFCLLVALLALDLAMPTIKQEAGRRMIEIPGFPGTGSVADLAFLAVAALMFVILLVAPVAG